MLPGPRRSLHGQVRTAQRHRDPDRGGTGRLALGPQRAGRTAPVIGPAAQQQRGPRVLAAGPCAHHPVTQIPQPIPLLPGPGRPRLDQGRGPRPGVGAAHLQVDRPARIVHGADRPLLVRVRITGRAARGELVLLRREANRRTTDFLTWPTMSPPVSLPTASGSAISSAGVTVRTWKYRHQAV